MRQASKRIPESAEKTFRDIHRATRRHHSAEEKIGNVGFNQPGIQNCLDALMKHRAVRQPHSV